MAEPTVTGVADTPEAAEAFKQFADGASPNPRIDQKWPDDPSQPPKLIGGDLNPEYRGDPEVAGRTPPGEQPTEEGKAPVGENDDHRVINDGDLGTDQRTDPETGAPVDENFQPASTGEALTGSTGDAEGASQLRTDPVPSNPTPFGQTIEPAADTPPMAPNRDAPVIRKADEDASTNAPTPIVDAPENEAPTSVNPTTRRKGGSAPATDATVAPVEDKSAAPVEQPGNYFSEPTKP